MHHFNAIFLFYSANFRKCQKNHVEIGYNFLPVLYLTLSCQVWNLTKFQCIRNVLSVCGRSVKLHHLRLALSFLCLLADEQLLEHPTSCRTLDNWSRWHILCLSRPPLCLIYTPSQQHFNQSTLNTGWFINKRIARYNDKSLVNN